jgi:hypothetical protein
MILKPAVLECAGCGKIFIGYERDVMPKGGPRCLKCAAREAWDVVVDALGSGKRGASASRGPRGAAKTAGRGAAGKKKAAGKGRGGKGGRR